MTARTAFTIFMLHVALTIEKKKEALVRLLMSLHVLFGYVFCFVFLFYPPPCHCFQRNDYCMYRRGFRFCPETVMLAVWIHTNIQKNIPNSTVCHAHPQVKLSNAF